MAGKRDLWLAAGVALMALAGFLVLRPQPEPVVDDRPIDAAVVVTTTTAGPLLGELAGSVDRVLTDAGNAEVVAPSELSQLPASVVRVLIDRRAVLRLAEEAS
jgi:hypothetical protein